MHQVSKAFVAALAVCSVGWTLPAAGQAQLDLPTVVELFTSQGCSSCPPADRLLGELAKRPGIVALSYNVDYWDYIGWKDTFASPENTQRQRDYAAAMGERRIYTPQMVIGGLDHAVGSNEHAVAGAIARAQRAALPRFPVEVVDKDDMVLVRLPQQRLAKDATIWLVRYDHSGTVEIQRGENHGRTVTYHKVVREFVNLGLYRGQAMEIALDMTALAKGGTDGCAILVQLERHGPIIAAARIEWSPDDS